MNEHPTYKELDQNTKRMIQKKMHEMFNHTARNEAIKDVLEYINPIVNPETLTFVQMTVDNLMSEIRNWNLTEYWLNKVKH